jgi:DNA-binding transcriptional LysR family regulator
VLRLPKLYVKLIVYIVGIQKMNLRQTDLGLLIALDALIAERSVTRAALRLGLSQPAMSSQLARLRDLFADPLLVPSGKKMLPTARATELRDPLHQLLTELTDLVRKRQTFDPALANQVFKVMSTDFLHRLVSMPAVGMFTQIAPGLQTALLLYDSKHAWLALENDEADFLIISDRLTPREAKTQILFDEGFVFAQRKGHPRGNVPPNLDEFCQLAHVLLSPEGGEFTNPIDDKLAKLSRKRKVAVSLPSFLLACPLIANTDFVAVLPERLALLMQSEIEIFPLPFKSARLKVVLSWHSRRELEPAHKWFRQQLALAYESP